MKIPTELFLDGIQAKKVYYFSSTKINTTEPHYFVCINRTDNELLIMTCCTSQFDTVKRFVATSDLPMETLVWITAQDASNPFTKDTYVNCNNSFTYTIEEFKAMYESNDVSFSGEISANHYEQILIGLHSSPMIDDETKEMIPNPNSV